jgi:hypothetical protein
VDSLTAQEIEADNKKAERQWKDALFIHKPKLYEHLYKQQESEVDGDTVEYRIPQTVGEVAEALNMVRQAGGPELDFSHEEADDDWSWVDRFKKEQADAETEEATASAGDTDAFDALESQDWED